MTYLVARNGWLWTSLALVSIVAARMSSDAYERRGMVQGATSLALLLGMIGQGASMLHRNQRATELLTDLRAAPAFVGASVGSVCIHVGALWARGGGSLRRCGLVGSGAVLVWLMLLATAAVGGLISFATASHDEVAYKRYLNYLRLEFDTKLGMYSPR